MLNLLFAHGGTVAYALLACSVVALAATIVALVRLLPQRRETRTLDARLATMSGAEIQTASTQGHALAQVLAAGLRAGQQSESVESSGSGKAQAEKTNPVAAAQAQAFDAAQRQVASLESGLGIIATVAQIAPLLGLLGTVLGLIDAFQHAGPQGAAEAMSVGIYQALVTTAAGLLVAIPAWVVYQTLTGISGQIIRSCEHLANDQGWWRRHVGS